jgi:hypothetical protein
MDHAIHLLISEAGDAALSRKASRTMADPQGHAVCRRASVLEASRHRGVIYMTPRPSFLFITTHKTSIDRT